MDLDCSAKWHPLSRYRTTTFTNLTAVKVQRHFKTNIPERSKVILHSCAYKPLVIVSSRRVYYYKCGQIGLVCGERLWE